MDGDTKQTRAFEGDPPTPARMLTETNCRGHETTFWGVYCRSCRELIAFDVCPYASFGPTAASQQPGAIRCRHGHNHIYFPRDFQFVRSTAAIPANVMLANRDAYRAINPSPSGLPSGSTWNAAEPRPWQPPVAPAGSSDTPAQPTAPDPARKTAQAVAKDRWAYWAIKKAR
jgi:hypothetical protein